MAYDFGMFKRGNEQLKSTVCLHSLIRVKMFDYGIHLTCLWIVIAGLHEGAITFVQFHPVDTSKVMTNAMDSCIRILDVKKCSVVISLKDDEFNTSYSWLSCSFSPDGKFKTISTFDE